MCCFCCEWTALDVLSGWIEVLRGPSQQWPSTKRSVVEFPAQRQQQTPPPIPPSHAQNRPLAPAPEVHVIDRQMRSPPQRSNGGSSSSYIGRRKHSRSEVAPDALKKAKVAAQGTPVGVQLEECALDVEPSRELERWKSNLERFRLIVATFQIHHQRWGGGRFTAAIGARCRCTTIRVASGRGSEGTDSSIAGWDDEGVTHTIHQGQGGKQGDALMPLLFCSP